MFGIRANQLQRHLLNYIDSIVNEEEKEFAKIIYGYCFIGLVEQRDGKKESFIESMYSSLAEMEYHTKIIARAISRLSSEEPSEQILHALFGVVIFTHYLLTEFFEENNKFNREKYNNFEESLKTGVKAKNRRIQNIEEMLNIFMEKASKQIDQIQHINSWSDIIQDIFGVSSLEQQNEPQEINRDNIKALLMEMGWDGELIDEVNSKYKGLLTFSMSMLTSLMGTAQEGEFKGKINDILGQLGSSSQQMIFQKRFREQNITQIKIMNELEDIISNIIQEISYLHLDIPNEFIMEFTTNITEFPPIEKEFKPIASAENLPGFSKIFGIAHFQTLKSRFENIWKIYQNLVSDIHNSITSLIEFLNSLIRRANDITSILLAQKFKTNIPQHDLIDMEKAEIKIRDINTDQSSSSDKISPKILEYKNRFLNEFGNQWESLKNIITKKVQEEEVISSLPDRLRVFKNLNISLRKSIGKFEQVNLFNGYKEEVPIALVALQALTPLLKSMVNSIQSMEGTPYNKNNIPRFMPTLEKLSKNLDKFDELGQSALFLNKITKNLYQISPDNVYDFVKTPEYLRNPQKLIQMIGELPPQIKKKYQQKLISTQERDIRDQAYNQLLHTIEEFISHYGASTEIFANRLENLCL